MLRVETSPKGEIEKTIKDAAEQTGLTQKSIRFYESKGLLSVQRGAQNDYRQYTEADITQLKRIKVLR